MRKIERELRRAFPSAKIETTDGGHLRLMLANGKSVFTSKTPGCWRTMANLRRDVRRVMAKGNSYLKKNGVHIVVYKTRFGHFGYSVDEVRSSRFFATETEAMMAAFDQFDAKVKQAAANRRARGYAYYDNDEEQ